MSSKTQPVAKHVPVIIFLIIGYVLFVRGIFGWVHFFETGSTFLIALRWQNMTVNMVSTYTPYLVAAICVVGLLKAQWWARWIALTAVAYELIRYVPSIGYPAFTLWDIARLFKLAWLVSLGALLLGARKSDTAQRA